MSSFKEIKEQAYRANMKIEELDLVLFTFGNASAADHKNGVFAIKPSGVPYSDLTPGDMVIVDFENNVVEGDLRPSSDTKTHAVLYKNWSGVGGIVHTHSTYATAWAQTLTDIPILGTTHADHLAQDIPCTPPMSDEAIKGDYEHETGLQILNEFEKRNLSYQEVQMVLVGSHAPFIWGENAEKAIYNSAVLEEVAKMAAISLQIRPDTPRIKEALRRKHYERKHGKNAYYGQK
ncbi:L-ribulose-5-phosphate 4-epimerase [Rhodohalobacter sp. SW132]|uniref:L-ribulose-5-phosphate 4-epimerase n=1 Tax=Rhodohalobacter sp. SW132 TaxID=2293433 RepID=UPI000E2483D5|nr:L-ribulose-5-phosphate 4-epimerase [Rhodohalobacter sp. SW132]REL37578.1 L-ribulose-5-phosphate 4-epimerase [Rhodohalobacter sp. SW132]